ncbi:MAG TPA: hypothetical protein VIT38_08850 [Allosphingosinicella sp.]
MPKYLMEIATTRTIGSIRQFFGADSLPRPKPLLIGAIAQIFNGSCREGVPSPGTGAALAKERASCSPTRSGPTKGPVSGSPLLLKMLLSVVMAPDFEAPHTYHVDVQHAINTLDYVEMVALSEMYERWALTSETLDGSYRTKLIQWSVDYEAIADACGLGWRALEPDDPIGLIPFIAAIEARAVGLYELEAAILRGDL